MARPVRAAISRVKLAVLYSEQGGRCAGCHKALGEDLHVDHVQPLARGGKDVFENLQLLHRDCNLAKRAMSAETWFKRNWVAFLATVKQPEPRQRITLALKPELMERLERAAYWSRRSIAALIEESAAQAAEAVEKVALGMQGREQRGRRAGDSLTAAPAVVSQAGQNGDLFRGLGST